MPAPVRGAVQAVVLTFTLSALLIYKALAPETCVGYRGIKSKANGSQLSRVSQSQLESLLFFLGDNYTPGPCARGYSSIRQKI